MSAESSEEEEGSWRPPTPPVVITPQPEVEARPPRFHPTESISRTTPFPDISEAPSTSVVTPPPLDDRVSISRRSRFGSGTNMPSYSTSPSPIPPPARTTAASTPSLGLLSASLAPSFITPEPVSRGSPMDVSIGFQRRSEPVSSVESSFNESYPSSLAGGEPSISDSVTSSRPSRRRKFGQGLKNRKMSVDAVPPPSTLVEKPEEKVTEEKTPVKKETEVPESSVVAPDTEEVKPNLPSKFQILEDIEKTDEEVRKTENLIARVKAHYREMNNRKIHAEYGELELDVLETPVLNPSDESSVRVFSENRRRLSLAQKLMAKFHPSSVSDFPMYTDPSAYPIVQECVAQFAAMKPVLYWKTRKMKVEINDRQYKLASRWWMLRDQWESDNLSKVSPPGGDTADQESASTTFDHNTFSLAAHDSLSRDAIYPTTISIITDQLPAEVVQRSISFVSENGLVEDPKEDLRSIKQKHHWTEEEKTIFRKKYVKYPKNFRKIATYLSDKAVNDCVNFYYVSKLTFNYKKLVSSYTSGRGYSMSNSSTVVKDKPIRVRKPRTQDSSMEVGASRPQSGKRSRDEAAAAKEAKKKKKKKPVAPVSTGRPAQDTPQVYIPQVLPMDATSGVYSQQMSPPMVPHAMYYGHPSSAYNVYGNGYYPPQAMGQPLPSGYWMPTGNPYGQAQQPHYGLLTGMTPQHQSQLQLSQHHAQMRAYQQSQQLQAQYFAQQQQLQAQAAYQQQPSSAPPPQQPPSDPTQPPLGNKPT